MDGIIVTDMKGNILIFNKGAEALTGYRADEVIGKIHITEIYPEGVAKEVMNKLRSPQYGGVGKLTSTQFNVVNKNGEEIPIQISATLIYDEAGHETASVGIFTDLQTPSDDGKEAPGNPRPVSQFRKNGLPWEAGRRYCS